MTTDTAEVAFAMNEASTSAAPGGSPIDTALLIDEVQKHQCLYDSAHNLSRIPTACALRWNLIGQHLGTTGTVAKCRWRNLRNTYLKYKHSSGENERAKAKFDYWQWTPRMRFLDDYDTKERPPADESPSPRLPPDAPARPRPSASPQSLAESAPPPSSATSLDPLDFELDIPHCEPPPKRRAKEKLATSKHPKMELLERTLKILESGRKKDEVDHLFDGYALAFRKFTPRNQLKVKIELARMFGETELHESRLSLGNARNAH